MQQQVQVVAQQLPQVGVWEIAVPVLAFVAVIVLPSLFALRVMFGALMQPQQISSEA